MPPTNPAWSQEYAVPARLFGRLCELNDRVGFA